MTDFGIAKCIGGRRPGTSRETLKGKAGYMSPEYVRGETIDRRADIFALGVVLWEALQGRRLFRGQSDAETLERLLSSAIPRVSEGAPALAPFDVAIARALDREPAKRFDTTEAMARALEAAAMAHGLVAGGPEVGRFVRETVGSRLEERRRALREAKTEAVPDPGPVPSTAVPDKPATQGSRTLVMLAIAGAVVLAGAGAVAIARSGRASASAAALSPAPTPTPTPAPAPAPGPTPTPTPTPAPAPATAPPPPPPARLAPARASSPLESVPAYPLNHARPVSGRRDLANPPRPRCACGRSTSSWSTGRAGAPPLRSRRARAASEPPPATT